MEILSKYKSVWVFLARFFGMYLGGVLIYNVYLRKFGIHLDSATRFFTNLVADLLALHLPEISVKLSEVVPEAQICYFGQPVVTMIEGCNAISVMILFLAFIFAFKGTWKQYVWFAPLGLLFINLANVFRIYLISLTVLYYPDFVGVAHDYLFPGVIYGSVFLLWVIWVKWIRTDS